MERPGVLRWFGYAVGVRLPERYNEWVLHDATSKHWRARYVLQRSVGIAPLCLVWLLVPVSIGLRLSLVLMAALVAYFYSCAYMDESVEHRLGRQGFPRHTGRQVRARAAAVKNAEATARYIARYRTGG
ncbi:DUF5313 domain-containing protein [Amycolatopsis sp. OK19-0408]|uniref:DUF5313 domain-containing protein n=1 Tax=Amycolatopsis iheyensis TaxID=2945988 RepID=A0A9X2NFD5_9PSEU|nr:DUF5313 domain-containing protein [Amycolatopsis iheyensis]MCR6483585.1 DUF5313 domain-containing protein [Amycolatopsis iheyensis]